MQVKSFLCVTEQNWVERIPVYKPLYINCPIEWTHRSDDGGSTSETSVNFYQTTWRNNRVDSHLLIRGALFFKNPSSWNNLNLLIIVFISYCPTLRLVDYILTISLHVMSVLNVWYRRHVDIETRQYYFMINRWGFTVLNVVILVKTIYRLLRRSNNRFII
jgi:hypothetical protein